jgi:hypothetical protein
MNAALPLLKALIAKGVSINWIMMNSIIKNKFTYSDFESKYFDNNLHRGLIDTLDYIFESDQKFRKLYDPYNQNITKIRKIDSTNVAILKKIISDYSDLPNENIIGLSNESLVYQPYYVHILHQSQGFKIFDYSPILLRAIQNGNVNPFVGIYLYKRTSGKMDFCGPSNMLQIMYPNDSVSENDLHNQEFVEEYSQTQPWLFLKIDEVQRMRIDSTRKIFGLESIQDFQKKAIFQINNLDFCFYYIPFLRNFFICRSKEDADIIRKNYKEIK